MVLLRNLLVMILLAVTLPSRAGNSEVKDSLQASIDIQDVELSSFEKMSFKEGLDSTTSPDSVHTPKRGVAIALAVLLGPFGGHRLYLGTDPIVPIVYTITLGGGLGVLPLIDLVQLIITGDLDRFHNNGNVFMWKKKEEKGNEDP